MSSRDDSLYARGRRRMEDGLEYRRKGRKRSKSPRGRQSPKTGVNLSPPVRRAMEDAMAKGWRPQSLRGGRQRQRSSPLQKDDRPGTRSSYHSPQQEIGRRVGSLQKRVASHLRSRASSGSSPMRRPDLFSSLQTSPDVPMFLDSPLSSPQVSARQEDVLTPQSEDAWGLPRPKGSFPLVSSPERDDFGGDFPIDDVLAKSLGRDEVALGGGGEVVGRVFDSDAMANGVATEEGVAALRNYRQKLVSIVQELRQRNGIGNGGIGEESPGVRAAVEAEEMARKDEEVMPSGAPSPSKQLYHLLDATRRGPLPRGPSLRRALHTYIGNKETGEASAMRGDRVVVLKATHPEWIKVRVRDQEGWIPRWVCEDPGAEALEESMTSDEARARVSAASASAGRALERLGLDTGMAIGGNAVPASPAEYAARNLVRQAIDEAATAATLAASNVESKENDDGTIEDVKPPLPEGARVFGEDDAEGTSGTEERKARVDGFVLTLTDNAKGWIAPPQAVVGSDGTEAFWDGSEFWYKYPRDASSSSSDSALQPQNTEPQYDQDGNPIQNPEQSSSAGDQWIDTEGRSWEERLAEGHTAPKEPEVLIDKTPLDTVPPEKHEKLVYVDDYDPEHKFDASNPSQKGLVKELQNRAGRRVKAMFLSGAELWNTFRGHMLGIGVLRRMGVLAKRERIKKKAFALGMARVVVRQRKIRRMATKSMVLGLVQFFRRERVAQRVRPKAFVLGFGVAALKWHRAEEARKKRLAAAREKKARGRGRGGGARGRRYVRLAALSDAKIGESSMWGGGGGGMAEFDGDMSVDPSALSNRKDSILDSFTIKPSGARSGGPSGASAAKPKHVTTFSSKDLKNIELVLNKILRKIPTNEIRAALLNMDVERLGGVDIAEQLLRAGPCFDPAQIEKAKALDTSDGVPRALPDEFMVDVVDRVSNIQERLKVMAFSTTYPELESRARNLIGTFKTCCNELTTSERYRMLLTQVVLPMNNLLSGDSVSGFKVQDLPKLKATRNSQGKSFLDVVVDFCLGDGKCPLLVDFDADFDTLRRTPVALLEMNDIKRAVKEAETELTPLRTLANVFERQKDAAASRIKSQLRDAEAKQSELEKQLADAEEAIYRVYKYISQEPSDISAKEVFANVQIFARDVKAAADAGMRRKKAEERAAARERALQAKTPPPPPRVSTAPSLRKMVRRVSLARKVGAPKPPPRKPAPPPPPSSSTPTPSEPISADFHIDSAAVADQERAVQQATKSLDASADQLLLEGDVDDDDSSLGPPTSDEEDYDDDFNGPPSVGRIASMPAMSKRGSPDPSPASVRHILSLASPTNTSSSPPQNTNVHLGHPPPPRHLSDSPGGSIASTARTAPPHTTPLRQQSSPSSTTSPQSSSAKPRRQRRASRLERFASKMIRERKEDNLRYSMGNVAFEAMSEEDRTKVSTELGNSMRAFLSTRVRSTSVDPSRHLPPSNLRLSDTKEQRSHEAPPSFLRSVTGPSFVRETVTEEEEEDEL